MPRAISTSEPIPRAVLLATVTPADAAAERQAARALRRLGALGLLTPFADDALSLHRLLAAFVRQQPAPSEVLCTTATALANYSQALQDSGQIKQSLSLVPHLESVLAYQAEALGAEHPETLGTANNLATTLSSQGDYARARARFMAVLEARTRTLGAEHPETLRTRHNLACALSDEGDHYYALLQYLLVWEARTRTLGADHPETLRTACNLALVQMQQGNYSAAHARFEAVLAIQTRLLGAEHPETLLTAMGLAETLYFQGNYANARARYEAVLAIQTRTLGADHPKTLVVAHNLASMLRDQGDYAGACSRYETVLAIQTRTLGPEHPNTLTTAHNLALTLEYIGRWQAAYLLYTQAVTNSGRHLGTAHPDTVQYLVALSKNQGMRGYQRAARGLLKTWLRQMPEEEEIWLKRMPEGTRRSAIQIILFLARAQAVVTALLLAWVAGGLANYTGGGLPLQAFVVCIAVLSYWSRPALIVLFALAGAALAAPVSSTLPMPWPWVGYACAALLAAGIVPYGWPAFTWLLSVTRVRLLIQPLQRRIRHLGQRAAAWSQAANLED